MMLENKSMSQSVIKTLYDVRALVKTENELSCINSIIIVFESIDDLDILNKCAIMLYIRELSGLSPKQMTTAMQSIKKYYSSLKLAEDSIFDAI
jgi:hypothetical protein